MTKKGRPFLEIFASAVYEDYRFPTLELFAFLYALGTFAFVNINNILTTFPKLSQDGIAFVTISSLMGTSLFIFLILVFKNVAYGLGGDLEKGIIQTFLSYPLKRRNILTAKLLSAVGIAALLFFGVQLSALLILAPGIILPNIGTMLFAYLADFGYVLLLTAIILLTTLIIKKGGIALIMGIVVYFAFGIATEILLRVVVPITGSIWPIQVVALLNPSTALTAYYGLMQSSSSAQFVWSPTLTETAAYVIGNYVIVASLFFLAYYYFSRRLSI
jgi:ABC-type transport system involved in multi-copper enzyme maturation permease subunit